MLMLTPANSELVNLDEQRQLQDTVVGSKMEIVDGHEHEIHLNQAGERLQKHTTLLDWLKGSHHDSWYQMSSSKTTASRTCAVPRFVGDVILSFQHTGLSWVASIPVSPTYAPSLQEAFVFNSILLHAGSQHWRRRPCR
jgi:hypothetical protein